MSNYFDALGLLTDYYSPHYPNPSLGQPFQKLCVYKEPRDLQSNLLTLISKLKNLSTKINYFLILSGLFSQNLHFFSEEKMNRNVSQTKIGKY